MTRIISAWRTILGAAVLGLSAFGIANAATAASPFTAIYAFGDSLSDAGNLWTKSYHLAPVSPYSNGRFTNGPVWIQDLGTAFGKPMTASLLGGTDYAFGGAESGATSVHSPAASIDLPSQLAAFKAKVPHPAGTALFTLWIGANDLFDVLNKTSFTTAQRTQALNQIVANEASFVTSIGAMGAKNLLLVTIPDLGVTPYIVAKGQAAKTAATALTKQFNSILTTRLKTLAAQKGIALKIVDTFTLIDNAVAHPALYGYTNVTAPCWTGSFTSASSGTVCATTQALQNKHLFWDDRHPTSSGHSVIANKAKALISPAMTDLLSATE
jgi:phospholipase/lecithinase/hemolysin